MCGETPLGVEGKRVVRLAEEFGGVDEDRDY
jgi:hypothetical protein